MRKALSLTLLLLLVVSLVPLATVSASPADQFAGCADGDDMEYGARYMARRLNGFSMVVTAIGVGDFDPAITIRDAEGNVLTCNDNATDATFASVDLPSIQAGPSDKTARAEVRVPGDEGRLDYEIIVTSSDGKPGEFVLLYSGAEVFGSDNVDEMTVFANEGQAEQEVPLVIYVTNLSGGESAYDPSLTFSFGENFSNTCGKSSADSLCDGDHEDLTGFTVTLEEEKPIALNGNDVMLAYNMGGTAAEYTIEIGSYNYATFGPYTLIIHTGVGYPAEG